MKFYILEVHLAFIVVIKRLENEWFGLDLTGHFLTFIKKQHAPNYVHFWTYVLHLPSVLVIVPDLQESVYERMKKAGGATPFNLFVISEMECMHRLLAAVRETLLVSELCYSLYGIQGWILWGSDIFLYRGITRRIFLLSHCSSVWVRRWLVCCPAFLVQLPCGKKSNTQCIRPLSCIFIGTNIRSFLLVHILPFSVRVLHVQELRVFIALLC